VAWAEPVLDAPGFLEEAPLALVDQAEAEVVADVQVVSLEVDLLVMAAPPEVELALDVPVFLEVDQLAMVDPPWVELVRDAPVFWEADLLVMVHWVELVLDVRVFLEADLLVMADQP